MATNDNWDDDDDDTTSQQTQQPQQKKNGLREHADQMKRERDEFKAELDAFKAAQAKANVEDAIKAKGFDPIVAGLIPGDIASDRTKLDTWLAENGKAFKSAAKQEDGQTDQEEDENEEDYMNDEADAFDRISRVSSSALPPSKQADLRAAIKNAKDRKDLDEILRKHGNVNVG